MHPVDYFADIIKESNNNSASVCDITLEEDNKLNRCIVNPWNGFIIVLQHTKDVHGDWVEPGHVIGTIIVDDDDFIKIEIFVREVT